MDDFLRGYILAYFKIHKDEYSFTVLAELLGIPISRVDDIIDRLLQEEMLVYNESHMLTLAPKGRLAILNRKEDNIDTFENTQFRYRKINPDAAIPIDQIYIPEGFTQKMK